MHRKIYEKRNCLFLLGLLFFLMVLGSFWDYPISQTLYRQGNLFGTLLAAYGQFPPYLAIVCAGSLWLTILEQETTPAGIAGRCCASFSIGMAVYLAMREPVKYMPKVSCWLLWGGMLALLVLGDLLFLYLVRGADGQKCKRFIGFVFFVVLVQLGLVNLLKVCWGRPRMRMISVTEGASFQPWWVIASGMKEALANLGIASEEWKSFPSGHTAAAACIFLFVALPYLSTRLQGKEKLLFVGATGYTLLVAGSRIVMGAHFLTDVTAGFLLVFLLVLAGERWLLGERTPLQTEKIQV